MSNAGIINTLSGPVPPTVPTTFHTESGNATPSSNTINIIGGNNLDTSGSGSTVTIDVVGTTNHAPLIGNSTGSISSIGPLTAGQLIIGTSAIGDPVAATLTAGANITITNASGSITIASTGGGGGSVTAVTGTPARITSTGGTTPQIDIDSSYVGQTSINRLGTVTTGTWNASVIPLQFGGTSANLTASNGGIFYSTGSAGAILSGTATAGQMLRSGATAAPTWSTATFPSTATGTGTILRADGTNWVATTATYPATTTINQILFSSANNTVSEITAVIDGVLITSHTGVPSILANGTATFVLTANTGAPPSWQAAAAGGVSSVSGTANQVSSSGGTTPVISLPSAITTPGSLTTTTTLTSTTLFTASAGQVVAVTTPGGYPYTTLVTDFLILVDSASARTITPLGSPTTGQMYRIKDNVGTASIFNITITPSGKNIDGSASLVINTNFGSVDIIYNGTQWNAL